MNTAQAGVLLLVVGLSMVAGFATQRGSLCAVEAARDVVLRGRWQRFVAFLQCAGWAWLLLILVGGTGPLPVGNGPVFSEQVPWLVAAIGGVLFGIGAWINGGCSFGTLARLGSGEVSFVATLLAMLASLLLVATFLPHAPPLALQATPKAGVHAAAWLLRGALATMVLVSVMQLWRSRAWKLHTWRGRNWPPALAVLVIAICNSWLLRVAGQWPGVTAPLAGLAGETTLLARWLVLPAFIAGTAVGAICARRFRWVWPSWRALARRCGGGLVMGMGAACVPGGNGKILLLDFPALRWAGVLAYVAMVLALFVVFGLLPGLAPPEPENNAN